MSSNEYHPCGSLLMLGIDKDLNNIQEMRKGIFSELFLIFLCYFGLSVYSYYINP